MAKLSSIHGRRLRSVAAMALVVGATGAFTSGHAHAASTVTPAPITGSIGVSVGNGTTTVAGNTTGGNLIISVDHGTVNFNGTNGTATGDSFSPVTSPTFPALVGGTVTSSDLTFSSSLGGGTCTTAEIVQADTTLKVNPDGSDTVSTTCNVPGSGKMILTLVVSANGVPVAAPAAAATPELGSGELLATGLVPALGIVLFRRRRQRRAAK